MSPINPNVAIGHDVIELNENTLWIGWKRERNACGTSLCRLGGMHRATRLILPIEGVFYAPAMRPDRA
jgi:hypothetical protein